MNRQVQTFNELNRVIHEPGRLMIVALLFAVDRSDFLYLQHETEMNKGTLVFNAAPKVAPSAQAPAVKPAPPATN